MKVVSVGALDLDGAQSCSHHDRNDSAITLADEGRSVNVVENGAALIGVESILLMKGLIGLGEFDAVGDIGEGAEVVEEAEKEFDGSQVQGDGGGLKVFGELGAESDHILSGRRGDLMRVEEKEETLDAFVVVLSGSGLDVEESDPFLEKGAEVGVCDRPILNADNLFHFCFLLNMNGCFCNVL